MAYVCAHIILLPYLFTQTHVNARVVSIEPETAMRRSNKDNAPQPAPGRPDGTRPTMEDVAARAGVSQMTVSRVLRGKGYASPAVKARVSEAAAELGYVQNRLAGALAGEVSPLVGVVLPTLKNRVFNEVLRGVSEALAGEGLQPVFGVSEYSSESETDLVTDFLAWRPRGLLLPGLEHSDALVAMIRRSGVRVAEMMDTDGTPIAAAFGFSQREAGAEMARYMLSKGYRRFAYVGSLGGRDLRARKRFDGFSETVRAAGAQIIAEYVTDDPSSMVEGRRLTAEALAPPEPPDAIHYSNDDMAAGGLMHCLANTIPVPGAVALSGFNGLAFLDALPLKLATIETPRFEIGFQAAAHIVADEEIETPDVRDLGFRLVPGETC